MSPDIEQTFKITCKMYDFTCEICIFDSSVTKISGIYVKIRKIQIKKNGLRQRNITVQIIQGFRCQKRNFPHNFPPKCCIFMYHLKCNKLYFNSVQYHLQWQNSFVFLGYRYCNCFPFNLKSPHCKCSRGSLSCEFSF